MDKNPITGDDLGGNTASSMALAKAVAELQFPDLSPGLVSIAVRLLKDWIGVVLVGSQTPAIRRLIELSGDLSSGGPCQIIGWDMRTGPQEAALINGSAGQVLDLDNSSDDNRGFISSPVLPALFALAGMHAVSSSALLTAFVAGVEVETKLGLILTPDHYDRGWHTTFTTGVVGAAAAAGRLLNLNTESLLSALSIACAQACGLRCQIGTEVKPLHAGLAARAGLLAALAARRGVQASRTPLEGEYGYLQMFSGKSAAQASVPFGTPWSLLDPGPKFRLYACCACIHRPIDALLSLIQEHPMMPDDVESMRCGVSFWVPGTAGYDRPTTGPEGKFSIPYCLARVLQTRKAPLITDFTDERVRDPLIQQILQRISVFVHPEMASRTEAFEEFAEVTIRTRNGQEFSRRVYWPTGTPANPLSATDIDAKFLDVVGSVLEGVRRNECARLIDEFNRFEDVNDFLSRLPTISTQMGGIGASTGV